MSELTHDIEAVTASKTAFRGNYNVKELARAYRLSSDEYFGENVVGEKVSGLTVNALAGAIAIVRGEEASKAYEYAGKADSKDTLVRELETALRETGFENDEGDSSIEVSPYSIGPILPWLLGVLSVSHDLEVGDIVSEE